MAADDGRLIPRSPSSEVYVDDKVTYAPAVWSAIRSTVIARSMADRTGDMDGRVLCAALVTRAADAAAIRAWLDEDAVS